MIEIAESPYNYRKTDQSIIEYIDSWDSLEAIPSNLYRLTVEEYIYAFSKCCEKCILKQMYTEANHFWKKICFLNQKYIDQYTYGQHIIVPIADWNDMK